MISTVTSNDFNALIELFKEDAGYIPEHWVSFNRFCISSGVNEFILKVNEMRKELVIANFEIQNKKRGVESQTIDFLITYAKNNGYNKILIERASTQEMKNFAHSYGFTEKEYSYGIFELVVI